MVARCAGISTTADLRLSKLRMDNSPAALRALELPVVGGGSAAPGPGGSKRLVGAMKDLGTVPVMAYSLDDVVAFYPDGAWWLPCLMEKPNQDARAGRPAWRRRVVLPGAGDVGRVCERGPTFRCPS